MKNYVLILFLVFSCSEKKGGEEATPQNFEGIKVIKLKPSFKEVNTLGRVVDLNFDKETGMIFLNEIGSSHFIGVLKKDGERLGSFVEMGEGPKNQVVSVGFQLHEKEGVALSFDTEKNRAYFYSLDSIRYLNFEN